MGNRALFLVLLALLLPLPAPAAGPILVDTDSGGKPVLWQDGVIHFNLESSIQGTLGSLSNEQAVALVRELFEDWKNVTLDGVSTTSLELDEGDGLGSIDRTNLDDHFTYCPPNEDCPDEATPFISGSARAGESPILFDDDGSMIDAVQGEGASESILGFAGPRVVERNGGVLYITEGQAILNGRFINGVDTDSDPEVTVNDFKGAIFHELGHFIGIDHTQVNIASVIDHLGGDKSHPEAIPTMLPLFIDGEAQLSPHFDDKVAVSLLYPSAEFGSSFCRIEGTVLQDDGETELQGVNVVLTNPSDPLNETTSFVSGSFYTGSSSDCQAPFGSYTLSGLTPGREYHLGIERISSAFTGGSSVEPCDPPQDGFDPSAILGTFSCTSGGGVITTGTEATTRVVTSKKSFTGSDAGGRQSSGGGCSLLP